VQRCDLTLIQIRSSLEARDVGLIDLRLLRHFHLGLADSIANRSEGKMGAFLSPKASAKDSNRLGFRLKTPSCGLTHGAPPLS